MSFALREGFLHHGPSNRAVFVGKGLAHALHGNVRRFAKIRTEANDNQRVLKKESCSLQKVDMVFPRESNSRQYQ